MTRKGPRGTLGGRSVLVPGLVAGCGSCAESGAAKATHDGASDRMARGCSHDSAAAGSDGSASERSISWALSTSSRCCCQSHNDDKACCSQHVCLPGQPNPYE